MPHFSFAAVLHFRALNRPTGVTSCHVAAGAPHVAPDLAVLLLAGKDPEKEPDGPPSSPSTFGELWQVLWRAGVRPHNVPPVAPVPPTVPPMTPPTAMPTPVAHVAPMTTPAAMPTPLQPVAPMMMPPPTAPTMPVGSVPMGSVPMGPMAPMGLQPPMPMAPAMGVSPPWRAHAAATPAGNGTATRPIEVPDDESKNPKNGKGASANPTLGLRRCKVCNEKAYSARGVCMNTGCVTWPNAINDLSIFFSCPIILKL